MFVYLFLCDRYKMVDVLFLTEAKLRTNHVRSCNCHKQNMCDLVCHKQKHPPSCFCHKQKSAILFLSQTKHMPSCFCYKQKHPPSCFCHKQKSAILFLSQTKHPPSCFCHNKNMCHLGLVINKTCWVYFIFLLSSLCMVTELPIKGALVSYI